jgi:hypothetical protein
MANDWELLGYRIQYFAGEQDLHKTLKSVAKWAKENKHLEFDSVNVNYDIEIGWSASVIYGPYA